MTAPTKSLAAVPVKAVEPLMVSEKAEKKAERLKIMSVSGNVPLAEIKKIKKFGINTLLHFPENQSLDGFENFMKDCQSQGLSLILSSERRYDLFRENSQVIGSHIEKMQKQALSSIREVSPKPIFILHHQLSALKAQDLSEKDTVLLDLHQYQRHHPESDMPALWFQFQSEVALSRGNAQKEALGKALPLFKYQASEEIDAESIAAVFDLEGFQLTRLSGDALKEFNAESNTLMSKTEKEAEEKRIFYSQRIGGKLSQFIIPISRKDGENFNFVQLSLSTINAIQSLEAKYLGKVSFELSNDGQMYLPFYGYKIKSREGRMPAGFYIHQAARKIVDSKTAYIRITIDWKGVSSPLLSLGGIAYSLEKL